jgi:hypothetical protein
MLPAVADVVLDVANVGVLGKVAVHLKLHVVVPKEKLIAVTQTSLTVL